MKNAKLQAYMRAVKRNLCPTEDELVSYFQRQLDPGRTKEIQGHLTDCASCAQTLDEVRDFFSEDSATPSGSVVEREFQAVWERLKAAQQTPTRESATPKRSGFALRYFPLAASLFIAVGAVAWSVWWWQQFEHAERERVQRLDALTSEIQDLRAKLETAQRVPGPKTNVRLVELFSADTFTRDQPRSAVAQVMAPQDSELVFILNGQGAPTFLTYQVELRDSENRLRWRDENLSRREMGNFVISLPAAYLPPGKYRILLTGGTSTTEYHFEVRSNQVKN